MIKKICLGGLAFLIVLSTIVFVFKKNETSNREMNNRSQSKKGSAMKLYPYANSTDIYSLSGRYALDGTNKIELPFMQKSNSDINITYVNDEWLYYCEYNDGEGGLLRRIPLYKGNDNRDVVDEKKTQIVRDTKNENSFVINGNYYAGVSYGTVVMLLNLETKQIVRKKIPAEIAYSKSAETEEKYWRVVEQSDNWILWGGDYGAMLQMIPSGEVHLFETKPVVMAKKGRNCLYYTTDSKNCYRYDFLEKKKTLCLKQKTIHKIVGEHLKINEEKITCKIDSIISNESKIFLQIKVKYLKQKNAKTKYIILGYSERNAQFMIDKNKTSILEESKQAKFLAHIGSVWYLYNGDYLCYNETTKKYKLIDANTPEWNMSYAVATLGIRECEGLWS